MAVDTSIIGRPTGKSKVVVERGPVSNFARAVKDESAVYQDPGAAKEAGFDAIPAPPTFGFSMEHWGKYPELQPADKPKGNPMMEVIGGLMKQGGMVLHGEQEFIYHQPVVVGDVLAQSGTIRDVYEREGSGGKVMTFVEAQTDYHNASGELVLTQITTLLHRS